jgi:hypothetical protein
VSKIFHIPSPFRSEKVFNPIATTQPRMEGVASDVSISALLSEHLLPTEGAAFDCMNRNQIRKLACANAVN